jgi:hypothetical protein
MLLAIDFAKAKVGRTDHLIFLCPRFSEYHEVIVFLD